tara:strand:+ start:228 stop:422 length:195 start_codon:yes stop_codon:yes gene_type:complete
MLYADIVLLSTWFDYGGKTLYNGGTLGIGYLAIGLLIISGIISFFYIKKTSIKKMTNFYEKTLG